MGSTACGLVKTEGVAPVAATTSTAEVTFWVKPMLPCMREESSKQGTARPALGATQADVELSVGEDLRPSSQGRS